jgi:hypothetical protein
VAETIPSTSSYGLSGVVDDDIDSDHTSSGGGGVAWPEDGQHWRRRSKDRGKVAERTSDWTEPH